MVPVGRPGIRGERGRGRGRWAGHRLKEEKERVAERSQYRFLYYLLLPLSAECNVCCVYVGSVGGARTSEGRGPTSLSRHPKLGGVSLTSLSVEVCDCVTCCIQVWIPWLPACVHGQEEPSADSCKTLPCQLESRRYKVRVLSDCIDDNDDMFCRYIMYIRGKGEVFLLDRDNSVFSCPVLTFPSRAERGHLADTVLDGVCVLLTLPCSIPLCHRSWLKTSCPTEFAHATWSMT